MATVNFSVPDDVKEAFDKAFGDRNKSAVIAKLMNQAVQDVARERRRAMLFRQLTERRRTRPTVDDRQLRRARSAGRP
jgi:hypothetical protein